MQKRKLNRKQIRKIHDFEFFLLNLSFFTLANFIDIIQTYFTLYIKKNLLTDDNDFHSNDDKYSILCSTRETYDSPRKTEDWPSCVKFCPRELIYVPKNNTGLTGIVAKNTIPTGQYGSYVCIDQTLGVNRVWCILFKSKPLISQITKQHLKWWKNNNQIHF